VYALAGKFFSAQFPPVYERTFELFSIDIVDFNSTLLNSTALPTNLRIPSNGYALIGLQGGSAIGNLDYNAGGNIQTVTAISSPIEVAIDIKPGKFPNSINPKSQGVIPVPILTTDTFDATTVDPSTVLLGATGTEATPVHAALEDVNGDGLTDSILQFNIQDTEIQCKQSFASLTGETFSGQAIQGSDAIQTVGCMAKQSVAERNP
jgi:hypothetical protein